MRRYTKPRTASWLDLTRAFPVKSAGCLLLLALSLGASAGAKSHDQESARLAVRVAASPADVTEAVKEVTQDQIIHGTYSYEKERILYGAHSAESAHVFGQWKGQGTAYYKVAEKVLSPRYFKDSEDIGTISVRYIVQDAGPTSTILQIDAVFVDARTVHHPSMGNVESSEYAAIQEHLRSIQAKRVEVEQGFRKAEAAAPSPSLPPSPSPLVQPAALNVATVPPVTVAEMQKRLEDLRHQVELRVKDPGAQLKAAPFHSAATLETVPAQSEVLIRIVSPYWYGVETDDGHHGWIHHSQLEALP